MTTDTRQSGYNLPKIELSASERMWLEYVYGDLKRGILTNPELLKRHLLNEGKWPVGLKPRNIDDRLLLDDNAITLLGIWHVDPNADWVQKADEVIRYLKNLVTPTPSVQKISVDELSRRIGKSKQETSILLRLINQLGFFWNRGTYSQRARGMAYRTGWLDIYDSIEIDDPEVFEYYGKYEDIEQLIRNPYFGVDEENDDGLHHAQQLYEKVKNLSTEQRALDEHTARIIIELADDAIKEFGNTNQERKVELRRWKSQAELALSPATIEELKKRAQGQLLKSIYPKKSEALRKALLAAVALTIIIPSVLALRQFLPVRSDATKTESSPTPLPIQPTDKDSKPTPTPSQSATPTPAISATPASTQAPLGLPDLFSMYNPKDLLSEELGHLSLEKYIRTRILNRRRADDVSVFMLVVELKKAGYKTIGDVDKALSRGRKAFEAYDKDSFGHSSDADVVRDTISIVDKNFLEVNASTEFPTFTHSLKRKYAKYRHLVK